MRARLPIVMLVTARFQRSYFAHGIVSDGD